MIRPNSLLGLVLANFFRAVDEYASLNGYFTEPFRMIAACERVEGFGKILLDAADLSKDDKDDIRARLEEYPKDKLERLPETKKLFDEIIQSTRHNFRRPPVPIPINEINAVQR